MRDTLYELSLRSLSQITSRKCHKIPTSALPRVWRVSNILCCKRYSRQGPLKRKKSKNVTKKWRRKLLARKEYIETYGPSLTQTQDKSMQKRTKLHETESKKIHIHCTAVLNSPAKNFYTRTSSPSEPKCKHFPCTNTIVKAGFECVSVHFKWILILFKWIKILMTERPKLGTGSLHISPFLDWAICSE